MKIENSAGAHAAPLYHTWCDTSVIQANIVVGDKLLPAAKIVYFPLYTNTKF